MKTKVQANAKKGLQQRNAEKKQKFMQDYDRRKIIRFKTGEELNMDKFFYHAKFTDELPKHARAVYPVLCARADFRNQNQPLQISRENIAQLSGISANAVDNAITFLLETNYTGADRSTAPLLSRQFVQQGTRRFYTYLVRFIRSGEDTNDPVYGSSNHAGGWFIFHTCIIDSGVWAKLSYRAKTLYLMMRERANFNADLYKEVENLDDVVLDFEVENYDGTSLTIRPNPGENFRSRKWDVCSGYSVKELFEAANMNYYKAREAVQELERFGLLEVIDQGKCIFKVNLRPKTR